jgi:signal peptidase I
MKRLLEWSVFALVVVGVWFFVGPTALGGPASYVIIDGTSMEPTYADGDLVIAKAHERYQVGDVITYDAPIGRTYRVIHRVIQVTETGYVTQGDNRDEADGWEVPFDAVHGSSWVHLPYGGQVALTLRHPPALIGLVAGWLTLLLLTQSEKRSPEDDGGVPEHDGRQAAPGWTSRMVTLTLFGGMAVLGTGAGLVVANASTLAVAAATLQVYPDGGPTGVAAPNDVPQIDEASPERRGLVDRAEPHLSSDQTTSMLDSDARDEPASRTSRDADHFDQSTPDTAPAEEDDPWNWTFPGETAGEDSSDAS